MSKMMVKQCMQFGEFEGAGTREAVGVRIYEVRKEKYRLPIGDRMYRSAVP